MKEYLKALGRTKKLKRARKEVEELLTKIMGNNNYRDWKDNVNKMTRLQNGIVELKKFVEVDTANGALTLEALDGQVEANRDAIAVALVLIKVEGQPTLAELIGVLEAKVTALVEDNTKKAATPKIRSNLERVQDLNNEISDIEEEYGLDK